MTTMRAIVLNDCPEATAQVWAAEINATLIENNVPGGARVVTLTQVTTPTNDGRVMRFLHGPMEDVTDEYYLVREEVQE